MRADPRPGAGNAPHPTPHTSRMGVLRPVLPPRVEECSSSPTGPPGAPQGTWEEGRRQASAISRLAFLPSALGREPRRGCPPAGPPALPLLQRLLGPRRQLLPTQPQAGLPRSPSAPLPSHRLGVGVSHRLADQWRTLPEWGVGRDWRASCLAFPRTAHHPATETGSSVLQHQMWESSSTV